MERQKLFYRIKEVLQEEGYPIENLSEKDKFNDIGVDSLDQIQLAMRAEQEFSIEIPTKVLLAIKTVDDFMDAVVCELKQKTV